MLLGLIIGVLILVGVITGAHNCVAYVFALDVYTGGEYFSLGVHNRKYIVMEQTVNELTIGLVFVNIVIEFYKAME